MKKFQRMKNSLLPSLSLIGAGAVIYSAGVVALHVARNHSPDSLVELPSPDNRYRIVMTEEILGFPGSTCIKQIYVLPIHDSFDRNDEDNEVFAGACDGLTDIQWNGNRVVGTVDLRPAIEGVSFLKLKGFAAKGEVRLIWSSR